ncbi:hypothetical protein EWM64_g8505 [Hericium alpestre]|uniref:Uncharacterized protein n=1 Tax=Hericium alpestre TaxID=135208 RepID=A0A4Y9ZN63_9AGAM|nr:hypothetical protein EWM64_g8505 [Hericium alpestre]
MPSLLAPIPHPSSPLQITNDLNDGDEFSFLTLYCCLPVDAYYPAYSTNWFVTQCPPFLVCKGLLIELVLKHPEGTLITRARISGIFHVGMTWAHFWAEREDAFDHELKHIQLVVLLIWSRLPWYHPITSFFLRRSIYDLHEPFNPAGDKQIYDCQFDLPAHVDPKDHKKVLELCR